MPYKDRSMGLYHSQKRVSKRRGIEFLLSFDQWISIWLDSGHWEERGKHKGQYVMARIGDKGPYSKDNVKIITKEQNRVEQIQNGRLNPKPNAKLLPHEVEFIRSEYQFMSKEKGSVALGRKYGVNSLTIRSIINGHTWKK